MKILNIKVGSKKLRIKDGRGLLSGTIGLMFNDLSEIDGCLIPTNSIHTSFCKPLDLLWLDENFRIIEIQKAYKFGVYSCKKAEYCFELKKGLVKAWKGMKISAKQ